MRRAGDLVAAGGRGFDVAESAVSSGPMCAAYGCPLPGGISLSTKGGGPWHCRFHFGREPSEFDGITTDVRRMKRDGELEAPRGETRTVAEMKSRMKR